MSYIVNAANAAEPLDGREASMLAAELRALKSRLNELHELVNNANTGLPYLASVVNTATNYEGLPVSKGLLAVTLDLYKQSNGYTASDNVVHKGYGTLIAEQGAAAATLTTTVAANTTLIASHTSSINSHTSSITTINEALTDIAEAFANIKDKLAVGSVIMLTVADNPATLYGYGTWQPVCQGRYAAGVGDATLENGYNLVRGTNGHNAFTLGVSNLPPHHHYARGTIGYPGAYDPDNPESFCLGTADNFVVTTEDTGESAPVVFKPAADAFYFWKRVS